MLTAGIGDQFSLHSIATGLEASRETNAEGYRIVTESGGLAWVEAAIPSADNVGSDGRPSAILLPLISDLI